LVGTVHTMLNLVSITANWNIRKKTCLNKLWQSTYNSDMKYFSKMNISSIYEKSMFALRMLKHNWDSLQIAQGHTPHVCQ